LRGEDLNL